MAWDRPPAIHGSAPGGSIRGASASGNGIGIGARAIGGAWDLSERPVLLAGSDGQAYETRPTTSLARDLAQADADASVLPCAGSHSRPRRSIPDPDDRPIRPSTQGLDFSPSHRRDRTSPSSRGSPAKIAADRPLGGFFFPSASSPSSIKSRTSASFSSPGTGTRSPMGAGARDQKLSERRDSFASTGSASSHSRRNCLSKTYAPVDALTSMGFDEDLARVAIAATGGDVDRAVRMMLEDASAHDARVNGEWEFEGDQGWATFDCETDRLLREAFSQGLSACEVLAGGNRYLIDFDSETQLNLMSKRTRRIRRRGSTASSSSVKSPSASSPVTSSATPSAAHECVRPARQSPANTSVSHAAASTAVKHAAAP